MYILVSFQALQKRADRLHEGRGGKKQGRRGNVLCYVYEISSISSTNQKRSRLREGKGVCQ